MLTKSSCGTIKLSASSIHRTCSILLVMFLYVSNQIGMLLVRDAALLQMLASVVLHQMTTKKSFTKWLLWLHLLKPFRSYCKFLIFLIYKFKIQKLIVVNKIIVKRNLYKQTNANLSLDNLLPFKSHHEVGVLLVTQKLYTV